MNFNYELLLKISNKPNVHNKMICVDLKCDNIKKYYDFDCHFKNNEIIFYKPLSWTRECAYKHLFPDINKS